MVRGIFACVLWGPLGLDLTDARTAREGMNLAIHAHGADFALIRRLAEFLPNRDLANALTSNNTRRRAAGELVELGGEIRHWNQS